MLSEKTLMGLFCCVFYDITICRLNNKDLQEGGEQSGTLVEKRSCDNHHVQ